MKDWSGNTQSIFATLASSSHSTKERPINDYYSTDPKAVTLLLEVESFSQNIWEPACGEGHISNVLQKHGYFVRSTDLIDRGYGIAGLDFLSHSTKKWDGDLITNPPYRYAQEFVEEALSVVSRGSKVAMFLKLQFLEGKKRKKLFQKHPPKRVYVSSSRLNCYLNGEATTNSSAVAYAWYIWEKGHSGETILKWIN